MAYEVHLDVFEGPFELLLQLITAQDIDVYTIALTDIVDAFLAELERREGLDLDVTTEFILIAATLVELKCRRLLPGLDDGDLDEELALFEARDYLLARLVECRTYSSAAAALQMLESEAARSFPRRVGPDDSFASLAPDLLAGVDANDLVEAARHAMAERPVARVDVGHVHTDEVNVAEVIENVARRLRDDGRASFVGLTAECSSLAQVVAVFLALLELYKRGIVELDQPASFGELSASWIGGDHGLEEVGDEWASFPGVAAPTGAREVVT